MCEKLNAMLLPTPHNLLSPLGAAALFACAVAGQAPSTQISGGADVRRSVYPKALTGGNYMHNH